MYRFFSKFYPKKLRENYIAMLKYSKVKTQPDRFVGFIMISGIGLGLVAAFQLSPIIKIPFWITWLAGFMTFESMIYMWIFLQVTRKAYEVEKFLPDVLQLMASNLRAGLTVDNALMLSARPEFGVLGGEIERVGKEVTIGKTVEDSLVSMLDRVKSDKLEKSLLLIVAGLKSGGELSDLLENTARNLRDEDLTDQKIRSSVMSYVIFVVAAVGFGAPVLYGLSSFLIEVLKKVFAQIRIPQTTAIDIPLKITQITIEPRFVIMYAVTSLITTSILSSLVVGAITKGRSRDGLKYAPFIILATLAMFFLSRKAISYILGGLFNF